MGGNFLPCTREQRILLPPTWQGWVPEGGSSLVHPRCRDPDGSTTDEFLVPNRFEHGFEQQVRRRGHTVPRPTNFDLPMSDGRQLQN